MSPWFWVTTIVFMVVSIILVMVILVQRPQGGGLAGAFGGAGGSGTETVFGGRVGDALTLFTVLGFVVYLGLAITLNMLDSVPGAAAPMTPAMTAPLLPDDVSMPSSPPTSAPATAPPPPQGEPDEPDQP